MSDSTPPNEREIAVRELITFIAQYSTLLERQLESVRANMAETVEEVMTQIQSVSKARDDKTKMAETVLIKKSRSSEANQNITQEEADNFVAASAKQLEELEKPQLKLELAKGQGHLTENIKEAGSKMRTYMGSLKNLDSRLESLLLIMMGALSADDVVGQRLEHVDMAIVNLKDELAKVIKHFDEQFETTMLRQVTKTLEQKLYKSYTMEDEKKVFRDVFGYDSKSA